MRTHSSRFGTVVSRSDSVPAVRISLAVVLCAVLLLAGPGVDASASAQAEASASKADALSPRAYAREAFRTTNRVRVQRDRVKTGTNGCLQRFARRQANALAERDIQSLDHSDHQDLVPVLRRCGLRLAGENLALGFATGQDAVKDGWMKSASHRRNILERRYRQMALVSRLTASGRWVAVQLFGRRA